MNTLISEAEAFGLLQDRRAAFSAAAAPFLARVVPDDLSGGGVAAAAEP